MAEQLNLHSFYKAIKPVHWLQNHVCRTCLSIHTFGWVYAKHTISIHVKMTRMSIPHMYDFFCYDFKMSSAAYKSPHSNHGTLPMDSS